MCVQVYLKPQLLKRHTDSFTKESPNHQHVAFFPTFQGMGTLGAGHREIDVQSSHGHLKSLFIHIFWSLSLSFSSCPSILFYLSPEKFLTSSCLNPLCPNRKTLILPSLPLILYTSKILIDSKMSHLDKHKDTGQNKWFFFKY